MSAGDRTRRTRRRRRRPQSQRTPVNALGAVPESMRVKDASRIPQSVRRRFIAAGNVYHRRGGGRAFIDRGDRLTTRRDDGRVIRSLAAIAAARGWRQVTVSGTARFRQQMTRVARRAGLAVMDAQREQTTRPRRARIAREAAPSIPAPAPARSHPDRRGRDRLIEEGAAPDRLVHGHTAADFVTLQTHSDDRNIRRVDPERLPRESLHRAGARDVIEQRAPSTARADLARLVRDPSVPAREAVHRHPALASTYLALRAAQLLADRLKHPEDQRSFVRAIRHSMAGSIARGEAFTVIRLRAPLHEARRERPARAADPLRE